VRKLTICDGMHTVDGRRSLYDALCVLSGIVQETCAVLGGCSVGFLPCAIDDHEQGGGE
jgi:hypothetical protein